MRESRRGATQSRGSKRSGEALSDLRETPCRSVFPLPAQRGVLDVLPLRLTGRRRPKHQMVISVTESL